MSVIEFSSSDKPYFELSNFYYHKTPLVYLGRTYDTSEHLYQSLKYCDSLNPRSLAYAEIIRTASTPGIAKRIANKHTYPITEDMPGWQRDVNNIIQQYDDVLADQSWINNLEPISINNTGNNVKAMKICLNTKFSQDKHCLGVLMSTHGRDIREYSQHDSYWGCGPDRNGHNILGQMLMKLRDATYARNY